VQILRACVRELGDEALSAYPAEILGHVAELVPEIRRRLGDLPAPPRSTDSEEARFARFDALSSFVAHAARERPLLLVLDDVHWADLASLMLLELFCQSLPGLPILVVATYRDPQAGETELDSGMLARLVRLGHHFNLRGLSKPEVGRFVEETGGAKPLESFVSALHGATNGNPFFVVEVLRLLAAEPPEKQLEQATSEVFPIPPSVRVTIRKRISLLPEPARSILTVGAVIGREFDLPVLERACERPMVELLGMLGHSVESGIVVVGRVASRSYGFSHGLVRETLYDDVAPAERAVLHRHVGEAIESIHSAGLDRHLAELAHHFGEASSATGDESKAADYAIRAARRASRMLAFEEAVKLYDRALALTKSSDDGQRRCELLMSLGEALWCVASSERAVSVYREAAEIAEQRGDAETLGRAVLGLASPYTLAPPTEQTALLLEKALELLPPADGALRALLTARRGLQLAASREPDRASRCVRDATAMARRVGDAFTLTQVLVWAFVATWGPDDFEGRMAAVAEIRAAAEGLADKRFVYIGSYLRCIHLLEQGAIDDARRELRSMGARVLRSPVRRASESELVFYAGTFAFLEGRLDEAERLAGRAAEFAVPELAAIFAAQMVFIRREQGRIAELADLAIAQVAMMKVKHPAPSALACWILAEAGRTDEARRMLAEVSFRGFADFPRDWMWYSAIWAPAETVTLLEERALARPLFELLAPFAGRVAVGSLFSCRGSVARSIGNLAVLLGRFDEAERHFEAALAMNTRMKARLWIAWTEYDYARMLLARSAPGDRERAAPMVESALAASREMGMALLEQRATALCERIGSPPPALPRVELTTDGERWTIRYREPAFQLRDGKGLRYLAHLLRHPGDEMHVADLVAAVESRADGPRAPLGDTGEVLDSRARSEYRERLAALEEELEEASARNDAGQAEKVSAEIEFVKAELSAAYGLGGRSRRGGDVAERIRKAVTNRIRHAIAQIERHDTALAEHLASAVRTGKFCAYDPDPRGPSAISPTSPSS
jgi:tetratricopeptide (TPR) repeat protein